jgi:hypothetical protein
MSEIVRRNHFPVMIGAVPLFNVTSFQVTEGYDAVKVAGGTSLVQMVRPSDKQIAVEALLIGEDRIWARPLLEFNALTSRALAAAAGPLFFLTGIPVVTKTWVAFDMQITSLVFTQDNQMRDTQKVSIKLKHVPRHAAVELVSAGLDLGMAIGGPFIP